MNLTLDPTTHQYRLDGKIVPLSVTQVIAKAGMGPDYSGVQPHVLERARQRGIHVDYGCDLLDDEDLDWDSVHPAWSGYIKAWEKARQTWGITEVFTQCLIYIPSLQVAGTADVLANAPMPVVIDRKTNTHAHPSSWGLQLAAYTYPDAVVAQKTIGQHHWVLSVHDRWIIQLDGKGKPTRYLCQDPEDYADFAACVAVAKGTANAGDHERLSARKARYE